MSKDVDVMLEPLFSCSDEDCRAEVSYHADMLRICGGQPICQNCYEENPPFDPVDWHDLPAFVPAHVSQTEALQARIAELVEECASVADAAEQEALAKLAKADGKDSQRNYAAASVAAQSIAQAIRAIAGDKQ